GEGSDPETGLRRLRAAVRRRLKSALPQRAWSGAKIFGSGGTVTNAARIAIARDKGAAPAAGVHGVNLQTADMIRVLDWLTALSEAERRKIPGLNPERADIITAGIAVAVEV